MGRNSKIAFVALLTLAIAGCSSEGTQEAINPTPTVTPTAKLPPATQSFNNPVVSTKNVVTNTSATPNLIQSTNAKEREAIVSKGRNDPFAQIIGQPVLEVPKSTNTATRAVPILPPLPTATARRLPTSSAALSTGTKTSASPNQVAQTPKPNSSPTSVLPKVMPQVIPNPTLVSVLPPPAQPDLAKGVIVSGVVLIGKEPQAIIKVPNEATSRYVQAGQRLAGGVLIKRIEMNAGSNPIVILEQYGIEVARMVGEEPVNSASSATTNAGNPVSVTTPPQNPFTVGAS
ncbi:MAG: hypothetical protein KME59_17655 [Trichormus sp. ATA11-4-KO1]|jgi:hypothetical protein|nr:hypothetical protein [Trichormus sp. ATA11-4-KO1]